MKCDKLYSYCSVQSLTCQSIDISWKNQQRKILSVQQGKLDTRERDGTNSPSAV